ncbi:MAG: CHAT domain-containing protein [Candidatus Krumholzibacteria bacterium]|nr:CHAT domain-containing protein [Candidatus Krumholzibacteria bacterium]
MMTAMFLMACSQPLWAESWQESLARADSLFNAQNKESAIDECRKALEKAEGIFGQEDTLTARILHRLGSYYSASNRFQEAEGSYKRSLSIRERVFGNENLEVANSLEALAMLYVQLGKPIDAEPLSRRSLAIREKMLGIDDLSVANNLMNLAIIVDYQGKYDEAESLNNRSLAIREAKLDPEDLSIGQGLNNLAIVYYQKGKYAEAEPLYRRALMIREKGLGNDHPELAKTLANLALNYRDQGRFAEAEPLFQRAISIFEKKLPAEHPVKANALTNLGSQYYLQGRYEDAVTLYSRALAIMEKVYGSESLNITSSLTNLANVYGDQGKYDQATELSMRALAIKEKYYPPNHPSIANSVINLAQLYHLQGQYAESEAMHKRALAIRQEVLPPGHPDIAQSYVQIANLFIDEGDYIAADSALDTALAIQETSLGPNHPDVGLTLELMSELCRHRKEGERALLLAERAARIARSSFIENANVLPENDALTYSHLFRRSAYKYLSAYEDLRARSTETALGVSDALFSTKGQVSDEIFERRKPLVLEGDSTTVTLMQKHNSARRQLSKIFIQGPGKNIRVYKAEVDSLANVVASLESDLSAQSATYRRGQQSKDITARRISSLLPPQSILIEYFKYDYYGIQPKVRIPRYVAVALDEKATPFIVDLGAAAVIDSLVDVYHNHMLAVSKKRHLPLKEDQAAYSMIASELYAKIFAPIESSVRGKKLVFIAPDGALNLVSFAALVDKSGKYVIEQYPIHYLSAGRDIIRLQYKDISARGLFALGDPNYDDAPAQYAATARDAYATRNMRSECTNLNSLMAKRLPQTKKEIQLVANLWKTQSDEPMEIYLDRDATEENFKTEASKKRCIHLATHGYYLTGACKSAQGGQWSALNEAFVGENPLLLSGLLLAGANRHGTSADSLGTEDGILTAYEVSAMDLTGTEVVVLSACETALGDIKEGEGVYGLRRAFQMAGARTIVSALWPVPDEATAEMMTRLYAPSKQSFPDRFRQMQLEQIRKLRSQGSADHPYTWAGFIAIGDWK